MNPVLLHADHVAPPTLGQLLPVALLAGLLATVAMNAAMHRHAEGNAPPFVAAGLLTGTPVPDVSGALASGVHYLSGVLSGAAFALLTVGFRAALPGDPVLPGTTLALAPHVAAGAVLLAALFVGFAYLVLPAATAWEGAKVKQVRDAWATSATVYVVALLVLVPVLTVALV